MASARVSRSLTGFLIAMLCALAVPSRAQENSWPTRESLPPAVVLVLNLLDQNHARPTTGVVVGEGLVLVPAEFVAAGDELVVLDGGTDVFRHGRPARTQYRSAQAGIAVLMVDGLARPPAPLAAGAPGGTLHLAAFPAAEQLTAGALPLWVPVAAGAAEPKLPGLPGPLLDACGNLAAYALAGDAPRLLARDELAAALAGFGLAPAIGTCGASAAQPPATEQAADADEAADPLPGGDPPVIESPSPTAQAGTTGTPTADPPPVASPPYMAPPDMGPLAGSDAPVAADAGMPPAQRQAIAVTAATALGLACWWWFRWRRRGRASSEPETQELLPARGAEVTATRVAGEPFTGATRVVARLPDGRRIELPLPAPPFRLGIGRAGVLAIDHPSLSRVHAHIAGDAAGTWVSDAGSTNGSLLGALPCLPGEEWLWTADTTLLLGEVALRLVVDGETP